MDFLEIIKKKQEYDIIKKNFSEYYDLFEKHFDKALALTVFEYQLVYIYTLDREDYDEFKKKIKKCPNVSQQYLFHGTERDAVFGILEDEFTFSKGGKLGKGAYFSDLLDVSWRYPKNYNNIPKPGDSFPVLVCDTFYSKNEFQICESKIYGDKKIPKNGVRFGNASNDGGDILSLKTLKNYKNFIQTEYLFDNLDQFKPIYGIILRRVNYLIIWRDNNFDPNNPNNYDDDDFKKMLEFNKEMKNFAFREINSKIYYVSSTKEALKLVDRKKYNKIILITNGGNNGEQFIKEARKILGGNTIALVSCFMPSNHINWVIKLPNTLLSNEKKFFEDFLRYSVTENKNEMEQLKQKIEDKYNRKFNNFKVDKELFEFPNYKTKGTFKDLKFKLEYNKENHHIEKYKSNDVIIDDDLGRIINDD